MNKHHRDDALNKIGWHPGYIVWFNYHLKVFTRFGCLDYREGRL